jgi:hypothetical protein
MIKNFCLALIMLFCIVSCSELKNSESVEYNFAPVGWSFKLPNYWVAEKDYENEAIVEKYGKKLGFNEDLVKNFNDQKIFMLKTKSSFNKFTSEIITIQSDMDDFERAVWDYKEQLSSQLIQLSQSAKVVNNYIQSVHIDEVEFKMFEVQFEPDSSKDSKFYMQVYLAMFGKQVLAISYTCIEGNLECEITQKAIEASKFKKI